MRRHLVAAVAAVLAVGTAPAVAAPVYNDAQTKLYASASFSADGVDCTEDPVPATPSQTAPLAENGATVTLSDQQSGSGHGTAPADKVTGSASATGSGKVTAAGGLPRSFDLSVSGQAAITSQQATSACEVRAGAGAEIAIGFVLSQSVYLHLDIETSGQASNEISFNGSAGGAGYGYVELGGNGLRTERHFRHLLTPGTYQGYFGGRVEARGSSTTSAVGTSMVHGTFVVPGAATTAPAGKALKYLTLPAAASCTSHGIDTVVTSKKKRVGQIKQVELFLGDARVQRVKHPKKGATVHLPVAAGDASELRAEVTLEPKTKGKKPKTLTATASYEACP